MAVRSLDMRCMDLAEYLLRWRETISKAEHDELVVDLAIAIMAAAEEWFDAHPISAARDPYSPQYEGPGQ